MTGSAKTGIPFDKMAALITDVGAATIAEALVAGDHEIQVVIRVIETLSGRGAARVVEQLAEIVVVGRTITLGLRQRDMNDVHDLSRVHEATQGDGTGRVVEPKRADHCHLA